MNPWLERLARQFAVNFLVKDRWKYLAGGLLNTLGITACSVVIGIALGIAVALIRTTHDGLKGKMRAGPGRILLDLCNGAAGLYLTVIRGTPVLVQLMIAYFVIFASSTNKFLVSVIAFGLNSGAYVAEIVRSGIQSVDRGQEEAGRSLGFDYIQTQRFIVLPQAFRNILPALANEFISLLKETSVAGYIGMEDLAKGADIIISRSYNAFLPLIATALIYLLLVLFFTSLVAKLERRLRANGS